jgi:hypothetical protein
VVDSLLGGWLAQLSSLAGRPIQAERLEIEFEAPAYAEQYQRLCSTTVQFGAAANQLRLSQATLALANPQHCPSTWQHLLQLCETELAQRTRVRSLGERITHLLGPLLNGGREPDLEEVAQHLQMPTWTCGANSPKKARAFATCSTTHAATWPRPTSATRSWPSAKSPICWGLHRPKPSSAHSSAGRA